MKRVVLCYLLLCSMLSCVDYRNSKMVMDLSEILMSEAPDSALSLLEGVDRNTLILRSMKERYTLLLTKAHDKCYMEMSADTSIRSAYDWYQRHGSKQYRMQSAYYLGVVKQSRGDNIEAVLAFRKAEPLAERLEDYRQLSLIEQHLCAIFASNYDYVRALEYAERSLNAAEKAGEPLMADFCRLDIAEQLLAEYRYDEAERIIDLLMNQKEKNDILTSLALGLKARILIFKDSDYKSAKALYDNYLPSVEYSAGDYGRLALLEEIVGNSELADLYLSKSLSLLDTRVDSLVYYNDCYNLYNQRGDWRTALEYLSKRADEQDAIVIRLLQQSETHALESFYREKLSLEQLRTQYRWYATFYLGIVLVLIIISLIVLLKKKNRRLLEDMAKIQEFGEDIRRLKVRDTETYEVVDSLLADKVQSLQHLSESFFSWEDEALKRREEKKGTLMKDEIISSFRKQLSELRESRSFISTLEQLLNQKDDDLMERARIELVNEKELDFSILTLLFSGFSIKSIGYLFRMSEASLRMRKTRYKQRFEALPEPERSFFLEKLG